MEQTNVDDRNSNKKPGVHYVLFLMEVWKPEDILDYGDPTNATLVTECSSLKCDESYSQILDTMELSLPKGAVIRKTIANEPESLKAYDKIKIGREDIGVVQVLKNNVSLARVADFSPSSRIKVYTGYTTDKSIADLGRIDLPVDQTIFGKDQTIITKYKNAMGGSPLFDGFIVKCSDKTPITISCESIASILKKITVQPMGPFQSVSIAEMLNKIKFVEKTKIELHSSTKDALQNMMLPVAFKDGMNMYDVFMNYLKQYGLYSKVLFDANTGKYAIRIGYAFTSGVMDNDGSEPCIYDGNKAVKVYSDYNVASDNLTYENIDLFYLAVKCHATIIESKGKRTEYSFCMRLNPDILTNNAKKVQFKVFNEKAITKTERRNVRKIGRADIDTSTYKVLDRTYPVSIPRSKFSKNKIKSWGAIQFMENMRNGITGSLSLFGDFHLRGGDIIAYVDKRYESRNGFYLIESVTTTLSTSGLRQEIKIPYKLSGVDDSDKDKYKITFSK